MNLNTMNLFGMSSFNSFPPINLYSGLNTNFTNSVFNFAPSVPDFGFGRFDYSTPTYSRGYKSPFGSMTGGFEIPAFDYNQVSSAIPPVRRTRPSLFDSTSIPSSKKTDFRITSLNPDTSLMSLSGIYNPDKGLSLAKSVASNARGRSTGYCARYVKTAISNTGLGAYASGHAYQQADALENNKNFKEISVSSKDLKKLPAGCVLVYDRGAAGYSKNYGHMEVTLGNGKAASDFVTNNIRQSDRVSVFVPV